jgi:hypothetical protein
MVMNFVMCNFPVPPHRARVAIAAAILGLGVMAICAESARAQGYQGQDAQTACTPDVFRLCQQFIPNRGPIVTCLIRSRALLSPACRAVFGGPTRVASAKKTAKSRKARRAKKRR